MNDYNAYDKDGNLMYYHYNITYSGITYEVHGVLVRYNKFIINQFNPITERLVCKWHVKINKKLEGTGLYMR